MELDVVVSKANVYNAANCVYINNQMIGSDKVDVVVSKSKIANATAILALAENTPIKIVGFIKDGDKGKKFIANAFRVGDNIHTNIEPKQKSTDVTITQEQYDKLKKAFNDAHMFSVFTSIMGD